MISSVCRLSVSKTGVSSAVKLVTRAMSGVPGYSFETLKVTSPSENVLQVEMNRPESLNSMNKAFWREMVSCFNEISEDKDCRAVILSGAGKHFTAGLDLTDAASMFTADNEDVGRKGFGLKQLIESFQESFTAIEKCRKPVIAVIHGACIGGGIDMITACDMRYCTANAVFQVKEVDIGLAADVGTLQRLPKVIGNDSLARELCYTARKMAADEAKDCGLVSKVFQDRDAMLKHAMEMASLIASKSPIAVQGTKVNMVYSRDHSVADGLTYMAAWNQTHLQSEDVMKSAMAAMTKQKAEFSKL